jgi:hypothetical protein
METSNRWRAELRIVIGLSNSSLTAPSPDVLAVWRLLPGPVTTVTSIA